MSHSIYTEQVVCGERTLRVESYDSVSGSPRIYAHRLLLQRMRILRSLFPEAMLALGPSRF